MTATIHMLDRIDGTVEPWNWPFADARRGAIAAHFGRLRARAPNTWNGRALLMREHRFAGRTLRGRWFETDYASFLAWRDWGFPDRGVVNCFGLGALRSTDGAHLLGEMGRHTMNAGAVYFPCGIPDPDDVRGNRVDLDGSVRREVAEETGLGDDAYAPADGWIAVASGAHLALFKVLRVPLTAEALRGRIRDHLGRSREPELADVRIVRGPADLDPRMPEFVTAFLRHAWDEGAAVRAPSTALRAVPLPRRQRDGGG